ncbi:Nitrate and nitrite sensing [Nocardioides sp. YR527]|uniref:nitrate- and nitrite sensing domain-containing protein n=1 Tax=Nocardioides sp. YR527 TaxID=1881028 RepID=UPI000880F7DA|nr:nitrate- and nitrite sensing domain-containing protein [Nocardioides sp. YR527]SDL20525.1 Nitrate and nitrite sensing [Nocardioides sp. YR527]
MTDTLESPTHERAKKGTWAIWTVLALAVIVAVLAGALGYLGVSRATSQSGPGERTETLAEALPETFDLAVNLSFERDAMMAGVPPVVLRPLQQMTDESVLAWRARAQEIDSGDKELDATLTRISEGLDGIDELRTQMRDDRAKGTESYTALTNDLVSIVDELPSTGGGQAASSIEAIGHMPQAWEALGQERAIMTAVLSRSPLPGKKQISDTEIAALTEAEAGLRRSLAAFYEGSSGDQRRALDELTDGTAAEGATGVPAHQGVNEIIAGGDTALTPATYVASSTDFIRGLQEVLTASAQEIVEQAQADRDEAKRTALVAVVLTLAVVSVLVVVVIVLVVLLAVLVSRRRSTNTRGARG